MSINKITDLITVWIATIVANVISFFSSDITSWLPIARDIVSIISIFLAIGYTLYRFASSWNGWLPWKKKGG